MAQASFEVKTYRYYNWSSRSTGKTNLILKGTGGETCSVWFIEDPTHNLPTACKVAENYYAFYYHHYQLDTIVDMLRNESPIYVFFNDENHLNNSRISTTDEPVGEGEEKFIEHP
ncbi:hypothetical protein OU798_20980 [Prolixibacteraceae bacterium Z1-6]|uniref:Uncharacterized protein n=1 Tax=Draconibacterium aestuarii TaxID=2998507 RepID=A0A9X3J9J0_9BACT|nr:hypothetical protein [Prolixibacteraceae bacterium Z1-6]